MSDTGCAEQEYLDKGWRVFDYDKELHDWVRSSVDHAQATVEAADNKQWLRCGGTWFVGVNVLDNDPDGAVSVGVPLRGQALNFVKKVSRKAIALDKGQLSVCYPGYPQPSLAETQAAYSYRLTRDAAHLDGVLKDGDERYLREYHDYILAIPMNEVDSKAAPFVVWSKSHSLVKHGLQAAIKNYPVEQWSDLPITRAYQSLRRDIFERCERVEIHLEVGQALVAHRLLLHGTAPWQDTTVATEEGRMICFFRPASLSIEEWLTNP